MVYTSCTLVVRPVLGDKVDDVDMLCCDAYGVFDRVTCQASWGSPHVGVVGMAGRTGKCGFVEGFYSL